MAKKKVVDGAKLIKMVEDGFHRQEIMKKFNIKTSNQLTIAYSRALMEAGKIAQIAGGRGVASTGEGNHVVVGKRGSVIISKPLCESLGIVVGDKFTVRKTKSEIALKKI